MTALAPDPKILADLWRTATGKALPAERVAEWGVRHGEPQRYYHTARHIAECLELFDGVKNRLADPTAVELALFFHDAVYDPKAGDNEEKSAELAREWLSGSGAHEGVTAGVEGLILATKRHQPGAHPDGPWMLDIDLGILGADEGRFLEYEGQIRQEYLWVPEESYRVKRAEVLQGFLDRPRIYFTDVFCDQREVRARENLAASIRLLKGG